MRFAILFLTLAIGGCAASSYCSGELDYQKAASVPPVKSVEGVTLPESQSALMIPDPPANAVPYGETYKDEDGDDDVRCLDTPPRLPTPPAPKPADAPAEPAPEAKE